MKELSQIVVFSITVLSCAISSTALAASNVSLSVTSVLGLLLDDRDLDGDGQVDYGGCMARVTPGPESVANCGDGWVTFSCSGVLNSKSAGQRKYDLAQMAMVLNKGLFLKITDDQKHQGYCYGERVDFNNE